MNIEIENIRYYQFVVGNNTLEQLIDSSCDVNGIKKSFISMLNGKVTLDIELHGNDTTTTSRTAQVTFIDDMGNSLVNETILVRRGQTETLTIDIPLEAMHLYTATAKVYDAEGTDGTVRANIKLKGDIAINKTAFIKTM